MLAFLVGVTTTARSIWAWAFGRTGRGEDEGMGACLRFWLLLKARAEARPCVPRFWRGTCGRFKYANVPDSGLWQPSRRRMKATAVLCCCGSLLGLAKR